MYNNISSKSRQPYFLSSNPDAVAAILSYCKENISGLSGEMLYSFIHDTLLPNLVEKIKEEREDQSYTLDELKKEFRLDKLTQITVHRWMHALGLRYEPRSKCYYVDNHDTPANITYRNAFIKRYFEYEIRCYRWYSVPLHEQQQMVKDGKIHRELGYHYCIDGKQFVEFHVDDHIDFQNRCNHLQYGGYLSVRKDPQLKPLMILGQDEVIFKQFVFSKGVWILPDGTKQLMPKDEGQGVMLSSFVGREIGYCFTPSQSVFDEVNRKRTNCKYSDKEAAIEKRGTAYKGALSTSPFVAELEYGLNNDGYWTYESMVLQLEDCVDILKVTHPDFDVLFLFDHSNGHDKLQPNGLSLSKINICHGGKQPSMRSSLLSNEHFGPFHNTSYNLQPGMYQSMQ